MDSIKAALNKFMQPRVGVYLWATPCDAQSMCARAARDIVSIVERKQNIPSHNIRIKEEILSLVDHDHLLTHFQCNALALLTLKEALRYLLKGKAPEENIQFIENIILVVQTNYGPNVVENPEYDTPHLNSLTHKHLGHGMKYLQEQFKKRNSTGVKPAFSAC